MAGPRGNSRAGASGSDAEACGSFLPGQYHSFEELEVWKRACLLAVAVFEAWRDTREFVLRDQMQRAAVSVPSNIAEGAERGGKDFERFLRMARGSAAELRTQLYIAKKIGSVQDERFSSLISELKEYSQMLTGLARSWARASSR
jgi:four helix bundle protein